MANINDNDYNEGGAIYDAQQVNMMDDLEVNQFLTAVGLPTYVETRSTYNKPLNWLCNESRFPHIAKIAKRLLCIPATSVPVERLFPMQLWSLVNLELHLNMKMPLQLFFCMTLGT